MKIVTRRIHGITPRRKIVEHREKEEKKRLTESRKFQEIKKGRDI